MLQPQAVLPLGDFVARQPEPQGRQREDFRSLLLQDAVVEMPWKAFIYVFLSLRENAVEEEQHATVYLGRCFPLSKTERG